MTRYEAIKNYIDELCDFELVALNNEYCSAINDYRSHVINMYEFDDMFCNYRPFKLVQMLDRDFSTNEDYFYIDSYGEICSTDNPADVIDTRDIAEYIDENDDCLCDRDLENLLDDWSEDDDEDDDDETDYDSEPGGDCCSCEHLQDCRNGKPCKCDEVTLVYNPNLR